MNVAYIGQNELELYDGPLKLLWIPYVIIY
jgi:hypothetical protein